MVGAAVLASGLIDLAAAPAHRPVRDGRALAGFGLPDLDNKAVAWASATRASAGAICAAAADATCPGPATLSRNKAGAIPQCGDRKIQASAYSGMAPAHAVAAWLGRTCGVPRKRLDAQEARPGSVFIGCIRPLDRRYRALTTARQDAGLLGDRMSFLARIGVAAPLRAFLRPCGALRALCSVPDQLAD